MEKTAVRPDVVLLLENFSDEGKRLFYSFQQADKSIPAVVLEENGFLPEGAVSVYGYFLGDFAQSSLASGTPLYFNQISVPEYWRISGTNRQGEIYDLGRKRGRILYAKPVHRRLAATVEWLDERGVVRTADHYNSQGALYAKTTFDASGKKVMKTYFTAEGQEKIVENFVTKDIILNEDKKVLVFRGKVDFSVYMLQKAGFAHCHFCYNTLSTPFFVSERFKNPVKKHVLFWQEPKRNDIPGNMSYILRQQESQTKAIFVQRRAAYEKLLELGADRGMLHSIGYIYPFKRDNSHGRQALICTNSDQIEQLKKVVEALPELHFHIAAITEMSPKLMAYGEYENVSLYPNVKTTQLDSLFSRCDWYFDINHADEIVSAVERAFLNNQLVFAFQETAHNREYVAEEYIYPAKESDRLMADVKKTIADEKLFNEHLKLQRACAMAEKREAYQNLLPYMSKGSE